MAVKASLYYDTSMFSIDLYPDESREWVSDLPDDRDWPFDFDWNAQKLERGEYELGGVRVGDVRLISDYWLDELDALDLPRVDVAAADLFDVTIGDVFRWARRTYPSKYATSVA